MGGPATPLFWAGIHDVPVSTHVWDGWLAHTHYWRRDEHDDSLANAPLPCLRQALDLGREQNWRPEPTPPAALGNGQPEGSAGAPQALSQEKPDGTE